MRISPAQHQFLKTYFLDKDKSGLVYLFGSRVDDTKKGGDIDLLVLTDKKMPHTVLFKIKLAFCTLFGAQKIDIVNLEKQEESAFKNHVLSYAILL